METQNLIHAGKKKKKITKNNYFFKFVELT